MPLLTVTACNAVGTTQERAVSRTLTSCACDLLSWQPSRPPLLLGIRCAVRHVAHELVGRGLRDFESGGSDAGWHALWRALARIALIFL